MSRLITTLNYVESSDLAVNRWHLPNNVDLRHKALCAKKLNDVNLYHTALNVLMTSCQCAGNLYVLFLKNVSSFDVKKLTSACLISLFLNFLSLKKFCKDKNKLQSEGARSREYCRCNRISQPSSAIF